VRTESGNSFVVADIPGLVEGASNGVGLGHDFLRHIERTKLLIHLVDISSGTIDLDVEVIENELKLYNDKLASAHKILVLNKVDLLLPDEVEAIADRVRKKSEIEYQSPMKMISGATRYGVDELIKALEQKLGEIKLAEPEPEEPVFLDPKATERIDTGFVVQRKKKVFFVEGDRVARLVSVTNMRDPDSLHHMYSVLRAMGVISALVEEGAHSGSEIHAGDVTFTFGDELG
jgi:GTP-binding protein